VRPIRRIIVHHAAATATLEEIDAWHLARGWSGVGYHFVVEKDGLIRLGRPVHVQGAHARFHNADTIGVCVAVDARDGVPALAWRALVSLVHDLMRQHQIPQDGVVGHRDVGSTVCPGFQVGQLFDRDPSVVTMSDDRRDSTDRRRPVPVDVNTSPPEV